MAKIDLTYLNDISGGDEEFIQDMIQTFLEETPKDLSALQAAVEKEDWKEVGNTAHKLKSSIKMFGMADLRDEVLGIEHDGKQSENTGELPSKVKAFAAHCEEAMDDLRKHL